MFFQRPRFDSSAIQNLESIAMLCWDIGGPATTRARNLLNQWMVHSQDSITEYNWPASCTPGEANRFEEVSTPPVILEEPILSFTVGPNPANTAFIIRHNEQWEGHAEFILMDMTGKTLRSMDMRSDVAGQTVDVSELVPGMYYGVWRLDGEVIQGERILVQR